jgi:hypothetical protein
VFLEVPSGRLGIGGVAPLDLTPPDEGIAQVGDIQITLSIMVREMPEFFPLGRRFDGRKSRIGELPNVLPAPLRPFGGGSSTQHFERSKYHRDEYSHPHSRSFLARMCPNRARVVRKTPSLLALDCTLIDASVLL